MEALRCYAFPITPDHRKLGFIGIGSMGRPIARRLLESGYNLTAYNRDRSKAEALVGYGAIVANSIAELASRTDVILSCLANDDAVRNVYAGPEGVFANVRPGTVVIEMSTVNPETSAGAIQIGRRPRCQRTGCSDFRQHAGCRARHAHAVRWRRKEELERYCS